MNNVLFWQWGGRRVSESGVGGASSEVEETIIEVTITEAGQLFEWYLDSESQKLLVGYDWGDGVLATRNVRTHVFNDLGVYTIKIIGNIKHFQVKTPLLVTKIIKVASTIENFYNSFFYCKNLTSIPLGLFDKNLDAYSFVSTFSGCSGLTSIPSGLFDKNVKVKSFSDTFTGCSGLTSIPAGLFDKNVNVTDFSLCFNSCRSLISIPAGLFDNNLEVQNFGSVFQNCVKLVSVPAGLFDYNVNVTNFSFCFYWCVEINSVPVDLFKNNLKVSNYSSSFFGCSKLTNRPKKMPENWELWELEGKENYPASVNLTRAFSRCYSLPDYSLIPEYITTG